MKTEKKLGKNAPKHSVTDPNNFGPVREVDRARLDEDAIKDLENEKGGNLIKNAELKKTLPELSEWLKIISRYGNVDAVSQIFRDKKEPERHFLYIFTDEHCYHISAYAPTEKRPKGYLGCIASCRKPRVGETWHRGSDLADGPYSRETFIKIIGDIVSFELKNIQFLK